MDFNKNLENATSMINARINNINNINNNNNNNINNNNTKKTSYDKWYDFAKNITTKPEERKRAPGVKKRRPPNVDRYVDTSDEEAYEERKEYVKAIQNNKELKKAEPEKEKKVLNYFNTNTIGQYLDANFESIKEKEYLQTKTSVNNEKNVELANYYFKHKEDKLYVEWISRIDKVKKDELKKKKEKIIKLKL